MPPVAAMMDLNWIESLLPIILVYITWLVISFTAFQLLWYREFVPRQSKYEKLLTGSCVACATYFLTTLDPQHANAATVGFMSVISFCCYLLQNMKMDRHRWLVLEALVEMEIDRDNYKSRFYHASNRLRQLQESQRARHPVFEPLLHRFSSARCLATSENMEIGAELVMRTTGCSGPRECIGFTMRCEDDLRCLVCLEPYFRHENLDILPCGHLFHSDCIRRCWESRFSCIRCTRELEWVVQLREPATRRTILSRTV